MNLERHCRGALFNSLRPESLRSLVLGLRKLTFRRFTARWPNREAFPIRGSSV